MSTKSASGAGGISSGTWCKGNGSTRASGISCTKSAPGAGEIHSETWCKGNGRTRGSGFSCTKSVSGAGRPLPASEKKSTFFYF